MPLPAAALLAALGTAARIGSKVAIRTGTKLYRGTAKVVKNPKKFSKRSYLMAKGQTNKLGKEVKRTSIFTSNIVKPHIKDPLGGNKIKGKSFHHIFNRPQFGKTNFMENYKRYPGATTMKRELAYNLLNKRKTRSKNYKKLGIRAGYVAGMGYYLGDD